MSFLSFFEWLARTPFSVAMRESQWGFATVETVHLLALAALGGVILIVNLRLLRNPAASVAKELSPLFFGSLTVMLVSGITLVAGDPMRYYYNPAFQWKMLLLVIALAVHSLIQFRAARSTFLLRATAVSSLALWTAVGLAGRAIGFI